MCAQWGNNLGEVGCISQVIFPVQSFSVALLRGLCLSSINFFQWHYAIVIIKAIYVCCKTCIKYIIEDKDDSHSEITTVEMLLCSPRVFSVSWYLCDKAEIKQRFPRRHISCLLKRILLGHTHFFYSSCQASMENLPASTSSSWVLGAINQGK